MFNEPSVVTPQEIREIAALKKIQKRWGAKNAAEMEKILTKLYLVKFAFVSPPNGHACDLFVIQPEVLAKWIPAIRVYCNPEKKLVVLE